MATATGTGDGPENAAASSGRAAAPGGRVLVAEDKPAVAMEVAATLHRLGYEVIGPAGTLDEALRLIGTAGHIDAAVLDINLAGSLSSFAADLLVQRGARVIFVTGYGEVAEERRDA